jgi:predicted dehydrogenase
MTPIGSTLVESEISTPTRTKTFIREGKTPHTPGDEGLKDHQIMEAIYQSARTSRIVRVSV